VTRNQIYVIKTEQSWSLGSVWPPKLTAAQLKSRHFIIRCDQKEEGQAPRRYYERKRRQATAEKTVQTKE